MAKKPHKPPKKNPGLSQAKAPILQRQNGERIVAQTELTQLQEKRDKLHTQLEELDTQILDLKNKRRDELLAELKDLGLDVVPKATTASASATGTRKGRPKGFKMSEEQKAAMKAGRQKAKADREAAKQPALLT